MNYLIEEKIKDYLYRFITKRKNKGLAINWKELRMLKCNSVDEMEESIEDKIEDNIFEEGTTVITYQHICDIVKELMEDAESVHEIKSSSIIKDSNLLNKSETFTNDTSAWMNYKKLLKEEKHFSDLSIRLIEDDTEQIRKSLSLEYVEEIGSIRGMVVGAVQSGKTANMGALIAQCADNGWNMFIVLGGMLENLRHQTEDRLINDLTGESRFNWVALNTICNKKCDSFQELSSLNLTHNSNDKYLCIALKQKDRLGNLIKWIKRDKNNAKNLKVLIIDDEADQASINTGKIDKGEKKAIYALINELVNGTKTGNKLTQYCGAMNYVCYTATPYANFLNDSDFKSLYPKNFIATLTAPNSYFGPQQIFGVSEEGKEGLSIVRTIGDDDKQHVYDIYEGLYNELPESMEEAILWFMCTVACMRFKHVHKPFSMLINASQKIVNHDYISEIIIKWFNKFDVNEIVEKCNSLWEQEKIAFNKDIFMHQFPDYENINNMEEYPDFEDIKPYLVALINERAKYIKVDSNNNYIYSNGIHLCVDNSAKNKLTDENEYLRIIYPNKEQLKDLEAPAFLVIGGNTLSRGLTIEGLVSSYFLRAGRQADTLMQMGRWFGYRFGYELYPRIWMDANSLEQFEFISQLDYDLRENLRKYMFNGLSPSEVGPLIDDTPAVSWLRITAKNKAQSAVVAEYDYTGAQAQTIAFENNENIMRNNIELTKRFLNTLENPQKSRSNHSYVWKNVNVTKIEDYLNNFEFCSNNKVFSNMDVFINWLHNEKNRQLTSKWNVVLVGIENKHNKKWKLNDDIEITKVTRTKKKNIKDYINIGVLRSMRDNFEDITYEENLSGNYNEKIDKFLASPTGDPFIIKRDINFDIRPIMVIYVIDKNSKASAKSGNRQDLDVNEDIIGIYINVPGEKGKIYSKITVKINKEFEKDDLNED